jgi:hypothetical protein
MNRRGATVMRLVHAMLSLAIAAALAAILVPSHARAERRALIIGINAYSNGVSPLRGSVNDAKMMREFLLARGGFQPGQVRMLLDGEATKAAIIGAIDNFLIAGSRSGDPVVFFFSGHGAQTPDTNGDEEDGLDETLVVADTAVRDGRIVNQIIDDELDVALKRLDDRLLTVIIDSCHSGSVTRSMGQIDRDDEAAPRTPTFTGVEPVAVTRAAVTAHRREETLLKASPNRMVWSAVSASQVAWDLGGRNPPSGLFTPLVIEALSRPGQPVTAVELLNHARSGSDDFCRKKPGGCPLGVTPTLEIDRSLFNMPVIDFIQGRRPPGSDAASVVALHLRPGATTVNTPVAQPPTTQQPTTQPPPVMSSPSVRITRIGTEATRLGSPARFQVESNFDGHLVLLDLLPPDAAGVRKLAQLYPNGFSGLPQAGVKTILAGRPFFVPATNDRFRLVVGRPLGRGTLIAVVTQDPVDLSSLVRVEAQTIPVVSNGGDYLAGLVQLLNKPYTGDGANRPSRWAIGQLPYATTE